MHSANTPFVTVTGSGPISGMTYINTHHETNESFGLEDGGLVVDVLQQLLLIE